MPHVQTVEGELEVQTVEGELEVQFKWWGCPDKHPFMCHEQRVLLVVCDRS